MRQHPNLGAFEEGRSAFHVGRTWEQNPYRGHDGHEDQASAWGSGWCSRQLEEAYGTPSPSKAYPGRTCDEMRRTRRAPVVLPIEGAVPKARGFLMPIGD